MAAGSGFILLCRPRRRHGDSDLGVAEIYFGGPDPSHWPWVGKWAAAVGGLGAVLSRGPEPAPAPSRGHPAWRKRPVSSEMGFGVMVGQGRQLPSFGGLQRGWMLPYNRAALGAGFGLTWEHPLLEPIPIPAWRCRGCGASRLGLAQCRATSVPPALGPAGQGTGQESSGTAEPQT